MRAIELDWARHRHVQASSTRDEPGRPVRPELVEPRALERRSTATASGHAALIHAVAHIEFNAINLALDAIVRFPGISDAITIATGCVSQPRRPRTSDCCAITLRSLDHDYGDYPAHDGLWEMAVKTAHDPLARMAMVPACWKRAGWTLRRPSCGACRRPAIIAAPRSSRSSCGTKSGMSRSAADGSGTFARSAASIRRRRSRTCWRVRRAARGAAVERRCAPPCPVQRARDRAYRSRCKSARTKAAARLVARKKRQRIPGIRERGRIPDALRSFRATRARSLAHTGTEALSHHAA